MMSWVRLSAVPHRNEHTVNIAMQMMKYRLRPNTSLSQPEIVSTMPLATRYDVSAQVASSLLEERLPAICGSATLTIVVSRISMNAADVTITAISHGLYCGFQGASGLAASGAAGSASLIAPKPSVRPKSQAAAECWDRAPCR